MSQIEFEGDNRNTSILYSKFQSSNELPVSVRFLIKNKIAKTAEVANIILLSIAVISFVIMGFLIYRINSGGATKQRPEVLKVMQEQSQRMRFR